MGREDTETREQSISKVLLASMLVEVVTGLALIAAPSLTGQLLLGAPLDGLATVVARVAGIALISLSVACWPGPTNRGMLLYNAAVSLYLAYLGFFTPNVGVLLWPAVIAHLILTAGLVRSTKWHTAA